MNVRLVKQVQTFPNNLIPALKRMPVSDIRNWDAASAWANTLPEKLT
ncbi:MAG: hypothetical protein BroJett021_07260 [Chloroflexota bacterium]|nr:MAG: hypothetical protein BroJett021_07260 [Chloroflexota bacterium]